MDLSGKVFAGLGAVAILLFALRSHIKAPPTGILVVGDSLSAGENAYPKYLETWLGVPVEVHAFEGKGAAYIDENVPWLSALDGKSHVVILAGVNDIASRRNLLQVEKALEAMYAEARRFKVKVVGVALTPWAKYHGYDYRQNFETERLNAWIKKNADVFVSTEDLSGLGQKLSLAYDSGDGLHLNQRGQEKLARLIKGKL